MEDNPAPVDAITELLYAHDPIGLNFGENPDEYEPEAESIAARLPRTADRAQARRMVHEEFVRWFGAETAGDADRYTAVADAVWDLHNRNRSVYGGGMADPISRFPVAQLDNLPDDLRERIGAIAEKSGFVPNVFLALGHRPAELRAFCDYHDALMDRDIGLTKAERELVVVATSAANHCTYCIVAHGAILRVRAKDPYLADAVGTNPWGAALDARPRAIVDLALALAREPELFGDAHLAAATAAGLTEDEIWDVGAITALFAMSNRLAHLAALAPNEEFFLMGRVPRGSAAR